MKYFVITIPNHKKSQEAADRCIRSGKRYGIDIVKFDAITPKTHDVYAMCEELNIPTQGFNGQYSRKDNCIAAFLSHRSLWQAAVDTNEPHCIFEHDAIVNGLLPDKLPEYVGSFGKPSYGKFKTPTTLGWGTLVSKQYFPGAHAYIVTPAGGEALCRAAEEFAEPTDVFINLRRFSWLQEFYPWSAVVDDSFSTIQNELGCIAKHNYVKGIRIVEA